MLEFGTTSGALKYAREVFEAAGFDVIDPAWTGTRRSSNNRDLAYIYLGEQVVRYYTYNSFEVTTPFLFVCPVSTEGLDVNMDSFARAVEPGSPIVTVRYMLKDSPKKDDFLPNPELIPDLADRYTAERERLDNAGMQTTDVELTVDGIDEIILATDPRVRRTPAKEFYRISRNSIRLAPAETEQGKAAIGIRFNITHEEIVE